MEKASAPEPAGLPGVDCFAWLGEPRRPWIDPEPFKARFLELAARYHPDKLPTANAEEKAAASRRYAELNAAFQRLLEPKERLRHLIELETGPPLKDVQSPPARVVGLVLEIAVTCRVVDQFLTERAKTSSPLLKAEMFGKGLDFIDRLTQLRQRLDTQRDELLAELKGMNPDWETAPPPGDARRAVALPLERLELACRSFSYLARASGQVQERLAQLSF